MHFAIVTAFHYPDGGPTVARHLALASGLAANGHCVTFILLKQAEFPALDIANDLVRWTTIATTRSKSRLGWRLGALRRLNAALEAIAVSSRVDVLFLVDRDPILMEGTLRIAKRTGVLALHELNEYPDVVGLTERSRAARVVFLKHHLPALDGILVISSALNSYVARRTNTPTLLLGPIVDLAVNTRLPRLKLSGVLVAGYAGSLSQKKDGVLYLLRAVAGAAQRLAPQIDLQVVIIGDTSSVAGKAAIQEAKLLGIADRVKFRGQVPHARVRDHLAGCHVLVLPRPASRQASGGFPTKLGEYLSTARPVITTTVGDIPSYLRHRDTCLMVPPDDIGALQSSLLEIALNYPDAHAMGERGRMLVERSFAATIQAPKVVSFVEHLEERMDMSDNW